MEVVKELILSVVDTVGSGVKWLLYRLCLTFLPLCQSRLTTYFAQFNVRFNGKNTWDIQVHNEHLYAKIAAYGSLGFGEAYVDGWWDCERVDILLAKISKGSLKDANRKWANVLHRIRNNWLNMQSRKKASEVIDGHYDLGKDLFAAFLCSNMNYSCPVYKTPETDLEQAQLDSMELIGQKLNLQPGMRVLDLGMGYGGIEKYLAEKFGVTVVGCTLSKEMAEVARERCRGLKVEILVQDYREMTGKFDRIISIEMLEHVGSQNHAEFFEVVHRCLVDDGLFLVHSNCMNNKYLPVNDEFVNKYLYKNIHLARLEEIVDVTNGRFILEDLHSFGADYDTCFMAWLVNFEKNWPSIQDKYDARFYRLWKYYLVMAAAVCRARVVQIYQIVFSKEGIAGGYKSVR